MNVREEMQAKLAALSKQADDIRARAKPLRDKRTAISQEADAALRALNAELKTLEQPLYEIEQDRTLLHRALNPKRVKMAAQS